MLQQFIVCVISAALVIGTVPAPVAAEAASAPAPGSVVAQAAAPDQAAPNAAGEVEKFSAAQLDALLAPIALYPDVLLTQVLMAATYPLEIVAASRWLAQGNNKSLKGQALEDALKRQPWDPSVKSLVPFPQVLDMLNTQLEFTQQLGFAVAVQEPEVFEAVQRLRAQAQAAGNLASTPQQTVQTEPAPPPPGAAVPAGAPQQVITIEPAQPNVVYVPAYDPNQVFGAWTYSDVPPVYFPPPAGYGYGSALAAGLLFGAGVAVVAGLWGWARPKWGWRGYGGRYGFGSVDVNVNRWNNISVDRRWNGDVNGTWRPNTPNVRPGGGAAIIRPGGPVGRPGTPGGVLPPGTGPGNRPVLPPGVGGGNRPGLPPGIGSGNRPGIPPGGGTGNRPVPLPGNVGGNRPNIPPGAGAGNRPVTLPGNGGANRPNISQGIGAGNRPNVSPGNRPVTRPAPAPVQRPASRPNVTRPAVTRPAQVRPAPPISRPAVNRPAPVARPAAARPAARPAVARGGGAGGGRRGR